MRKKAASGVLASLRRSPYGRGYDSPLRSLRPCWTAFLRILRPILIPTRHMNWSRRMTQQSSFSAAC